MKQRNRIKKKKNEERKKKSGKSKKMMMKMAFVNAERRVSLVLVIRSVS